MIEKAHVNLDLLKAIQESIGLLAHSKNVKQAISHTLPILGKVLPVDRVYFCRTVRDSEGHLLPDYYLEWDKSKILSGSETGEVTPLENNVVVRVSDALIENRHYVGLTQKSPKNELTHWMDVKGIYACLFIPFFVNERYWGFFGFENRTSEVLISPEDADALQCFSRIFASTVHLKRTNLFEKRKLDEFEQLHSTFAEVVFKLDEGLCFTYLSGGWMKMTGFDIQFCLGLPLGRFLDEPGKEVFLGKIHKNEFDSEGSFSLDAILVKSDGSQQHIRINLIKNKSGSRTAFLGAIHSIVQLQLDFQLVKEREQSFQSLVENVEDVLYSLEADSGKVLFISDKIERFGFSKKDLLEDPEFWWKQIVLEDRLEVLQAYTNFLNTKMPSYEIEYRIEKPDGSLIWINDKFTLETHAGKIPFRIHGRITEVTEQKNKEVQLEQTENRFRIITENLPFPFILSLEEDFKLIYYNFSFHEHFQIRTGEKAVFGRTWIEQLVPADSKDLFVSFLKENTSFSNHEILLQTKDGPQWYSVSSQFIPYKMGYARAIVFYNINKRKLSELEIIRMNDLIQAVNQTQMDFSRDEEIQDTFHRLLENLMVFSESSTGFLAEVFHDKEGFERLRPNASINFPWEFESDQEGVENSKESVELSYSEPFLNWIVTNRETLISNEVRNDSRWDPEKVHLFQTISLERFLGIPIFKGDRFVGLVGLGNKEKPYSQEDVDFLKPFLSSYANLLASLNVNREKRKAETLHKESESLYRLLSENIDDIVTLHDLRMKTIYASPSLEKVTGFGVKSFLGRDFFEFFDFKPLEEPDFTKFPRFVIPLKHGVTGKEIKLEMLWKPIYMENGELSSFLAASRDVTERELILDELKKTLEKEIELNQLKSKFISMTSHELRTPLATIQSSADLMEIFTEAVQDEKAHEGLVKQIRKIHIQLSRLSQMISDVMLFEKNNEGKLVYNQADVEVKSFILQLVYNQFASNGSGTKVDLHLGKKEIMIKTDPNLLFHVLRNLLENALKYTPEGNHRPLLKLIAVESYVQIIVEDFGIGIPEGELKFVFDTFFRASNVKNIKGTGLGLSIVNDLVKMLGGKLSFTSEENKGSIFTVTLPYERKHIVD